MPLAFVTLLCCVEAARIVPSTGAKLVVTRRILILAVALSTILAFLSGYQASSPLGDISADIESAVGRHHAYGRLLLINALLMVSFAWLGGRALHGRKTLMLLYGVSLVAQLALSLFVGYLGGDLVFGYGVGVTATK
jgi:uncharacterized membrane protein